jgi:hypothetical protein
VTAAIVLCLLSLFTRRGRIGYQRIEQALSRLADDEWVYNGAEIDNAKVLWARELDPQQNAKLLAYFKDRQIWLVTPDSDNTYLAPYASADSEPTSDP